MTLATSSTSPPASTMRRATVTLANGSTLQAQHSGYSADIERISSVSTLGPLLESRCQILRSQALQALATLADQVQKNEPTMAQFMRWFATKNEQNPDDKVQLDHFAWMQVLSRLTLVNHDWRSHLELEEGSKVKLTYRTATGYETLLESTIIHVG